MHGVVSQHRVEEGLQPERPGAQPIAAVGKEGILLASASLRDGPAQHQYCQGPMILGIGPPVLQDVQDALHLAQSGARFDPLLQVGGDEVVEQHGLVALPRRVRAVVRMPTGVEDSQEIVRPQLPGGKRSRAR